MRWTLPVNLEVGGKEYAINADYRDILNIISRLNGGENEFVKVYVCLALFYPQFEEMPESDYQEAIEKLLWFIACGEEQEDKKRPKLIDWEQDYQMIAADIIKVAGHDVRSDSFCHWWTFVSYFMGIGEGQLSAVVSIRDKLRKHKKLEKWEKEFYNQNRSEVRPLLPCNAALDQLLSGSGKRNFTTRTAQKLI